MFLLFTISACALAIFNSHFLTDVDSDKVYSVALFLLAGMAAFSDSSMRHRSVLDIFFIWSSWVLLTDWASYFPPVIASLETSIFVILVAWVYFRPYRHVSHPPNLENVCIAFYGGPNAPFLSRIASHFGFPFSSVALCVGTRVVRPSKSAGKMKTSTIAVLQDKGYVFIDTGISASPELFGVFNEIIGTKTGYGLFRTKCLKNLMPVLEKLGHEWEPKGWPVIPSLFYQQCVRNVA